MGDLQILYPLGFSKAEFLGIGMITFYSTLYIIRNKMRKGCGGRRGTSRSRLKGETEAIADPGASPVS